MGIFSGTAKGSNPMTTGGSGSPGNGKNKSPVALGDYFSKTANSNTRALAAKYAKNSGLNTNRSLSKPVAGNSVIKAQ